MTQSAAPPIEQFAAEELLSLAERAYRRLRDAIMRGSLPGGSRISERSLGQSLGISAQPVREALWRLEAEGMVITSPRRGTVVVEFDANKLAEMSQIRAALEGSVAALAARKATEADVAALRAQLVAMRDATGGGDIAAVAAANERFHGLLREVAGNVFLTRSLETLRAYDHVARRRTLASSPREPAQALREHAALLAALRRRDPELAENRMRAHVDRSLRAGGVAETSHRERKQTQ
ncbi:GntR family transcriptional regulator [Roseomonas sp. BN140053]|uniref:GntR family transcriptional regulator n=1 Tax=Roseomonas sp. BN140053 TaxID=3391898 RepID=UPI0039E7364A